MNSLSYKSDGCCLPACGEKEDKPYYPEVYLHNDPTKALFGDSTPKPGQIYETSFRFKVGAWSDKDGKQTVTLCLLKCDPVEDATETDEYEEA